MIAEMEPQMGKKPRRNESDQGTKHVRLFEDIVDMVGWIVRVEGGSSAQLLDPMIRAQVTAKYRRHEDVINRMRAAEQELRRLEEEARSYVVKKPKSRE